MDTADGSPDTVAERHRGIGVGMRRALRLEKRCRELLFAAQCGFDWAVEPDAVEQAIIVLATAERRYARAQQILQRAWDRHWAAT